jgi:hypothetical protein
MVWSPTKDVRREVAKEDLGMNPTRKKEKRTTRKTWSNNIKKAMAARDLDEQDIQDRSRWRRGCEKRPQRM